MSSSTPPSAVGWGVRKQQSAAGPSWISGLPTWPTRLAADNRRILAGERIEKVEQRPNGHEMRTLNTVKMPMYDARGRIAGILGYFADVTDAQHPNDSRGQSLRRDSNSAICYAGTHIRLRVSVTGEGMTSASRGRVFDLSDTTLDDVKGSGLGLTIIQDIVRRHGGWIESSINGGYGTCYSVVLPQCDVTADTTPGVAELGATQPPTILVVDNESAILNMCRMILEPKGYRVYTVKKGLEAAEFYRHERETIELVVLDLNMPEMSGLDVLAEMAAINPLVRILFMSGAPMEEMPSSYKPNLRGFLSKPFRPPDLLEAVRRALAES